MQFMCKSVSIYKQMIDKNKAYYRDATNEVCSYDNKPKNHFTIKETPLKNKHIQSIVI